MNSEELNENLNEIEEIPSPEELLRKEFPMVLEFEKKYNTVVEHSGIVSVLKHSEYHKNCIEKRLDEYKLLVNGFDKLLVLQETENSFIVRELKDSIEGL